MSEPGAPEAKPDLELSRATATMTWLTAVSRITGFVRIIIVAAVLGTTFLGNTYQSANTLPNILFELFAAGALQAVLIPTLVQMVDGGDSDEATHVAGAVLGLASAVLGVLSAIGLLLSPLLMRALVSGVADPHVRDAEVRLGIFFLFFFLPQTLFYAAGTVATALLNARGRFALPVAAPIVNNVVVVGAYVLFDAMRHGAAPSLDLTLAQKLVLAGGTTAAVIAFCAVPVLGAWRAGFRLRPNLDRRHPMVRRLARQGLWAGVYLAVTQVLLAVVLVLANRIEGGVVAYQVAFTLFLLPHALFAVPALTALFPRLARQANTEDWAGFNASIALGADAIAFFSLAAGAVLLVLAEPVARVVLYGASAHSADAVAATVRGFAPGIVGYGIFLFLTRAFYALHDARLPAIANAVAVGAGAMAMVLTFAVASHPTVAMLAGVHSAVYLGAGVALLLILGRRGRAHIGAVAVAVGRHLGGSVAAAAVMAVVAGALDSSTRRGAVIVLVLAGGAGAVVLAAARLATQRRVLPELVAPRRG